MAGMKRESLIAVLALIVGAAIGFVVGTTWQPEDERLRLLREENRLLNQKVQLLEGQLDEINAALQRPQDQSPKRGAATGTQFHKLRRIIAATATELVAGWRCAQRRPHTSRKAPMFVVPRIPLFAVVALLTWRRSPSR